MPAPGTEKSSLPGRPYVHLFIIEVLNNLIPAITRNSTKKIMMINADTKLAPILKQHPQALEAIVSINPKFQKLRNPLLRKMLAGRTSLAAAAKMGGCPVEAFFQKLEPLGFVVDRAAGTAGSSKDKKALPHFLMALTKENLLEMDVRPVLESGSDPLSLIMEKIKTLLPGQVLKIVNSFEPAPLMALLEKKGFETYADRVNDSLVETYFYKKSNTPAAEEPLPGPAANNWEQVLQSFGSRLQKTDVRHLEMPQPMLTILAALDHLPADTALYVYHKRIPVFLLPELAQRGFDYRINEVQDGEVHLLIFKG